MAFDIAEIRRGAEAGSCVDRCVLGLCYLYGHETQIDYSEAFRWLSMAADQGASRAVLNLAYMYANGLGVEQNTVEAIRLYEAVATPSDSSDAFNARLELARLFSRGVGTSVDSSAAMKWYGAVIDLCDEKEDCEALQEAKAYISKHAR